MLGVCVCVCVCVRVRERWKSEEEVIRQRKATVNS